MMQILEFRARVRAIYQKFQMIIDPVVKFIIAFVVFTIINNALGYYETLNKGVVVLLLSLLSAFTPSSIMVLLAMVVTLAHVYKAAMLLSLLLVIAFLVLYCFFLRYTPKFGYVVLGIPILYGLHIPYVIPILLGLIATPITILPAGCGVAVYYIINIIQREIEVTAEVKGFDDILPLYMNVIDKIIQNKQMIMSIIVFAIIITVVYVIRRLKIEYAYELAIAAGSISCIIAFLIVDLRLELPKQIGGMILGTIISAVIAFIIQFFIRVLDYTAVENVQFEDDDYYYYVKAVPKINVSMPNVKVKRINAQHDSSDQEDEDSEEEELTTRQLDRRILERRTKEAMTHDNL